MIGLRLRLTGSSRPLLTEPAAYRQIEERNEENSEHSGSQHSADNTGPNRDSARRTGTGSNEERYHATDEGERRHDNGAQAQRSEEHTSELQSLMRISYAVFCLHKKKNKSQCSLHLTQK